MDYTLFIDKARVDVTEDSYLNGESTYSAHDFDLDVSGYECASLEELVSDIADASGVFSSDIADYVYCSGTIQTDALVNSDDYGYLTEPTDEEYRLWKQGKFTLYNAHLFCRVSVVNADGWSRKMTEDDALSLGLSVE